MSSTPNTDEAARLRALDRARRLNELAAGTPFPAEAKAAAAQLARLLKTHGLTLEQLAGAAEQRTEQLLIAYTTADERTLAAHIFITVSDDWEIELTGRASGNTKTRGSFAAELTPYEAALGRAMWRAYRPALVEHLNRSRAAFMNAHRLFPPSPRPGRELPEQAGKGGSDGSDEDAAAIRKMMGAVAPVDLDFGKLGNPPAALPAARRALGEGGRQ